MKCGYVRGNLLALLEGDIGPEERAAVQDHLERCDECRNELRMLQRGRDALVASLQQVAPSGRYLTQGRLDRLLGASEAPAETPRIITLRRFIAAAAAAAILVSSLFIYGDVRSILDRRRQPEMAYPSVARVPGSGLASMVALSPTPHDYRLDIVLGYTGGGSAWGTPAAQVRPANLIRTTSPGIDVPVRNAFYDSEEAGFWW